MWVKSDFSVTFKDAGTLEEAWLACANGGEFTGRRGRRERAKRLRATQQEASMRTVIGKLVEGTTQTEAVSERATVGTQTESKHEQAAAMEVYEDENEEGEQIECDNASELAVPEEDATDGMSSEDEEGGTSDEDGEGADAMAGEGEDSECEDDGEIDESGPAKELASVGVEQPGGAVVLHAPLYRTEEQWENIREQLERTNEMMLAFETTLQGWRSISNKPVTESTTWAVGHLDRPIEPTASIEEWQPAGKRPQRKAQWQGKQGNKQLSRREAYGTDHQHGDAGLGT